MQPHHVDVARAIGFAFFEDLARLVHRSQQKAAQDFFVDWYTTALAPVEGAPANVRVTMSEPFEVSGRDNLMISAQSPVNNSWVFVSGDLVNEASGKLDSFELPIEYYSGVSDGERWSPSTAGRCACSCRASTSGRARSGCAASRSSTTTNPASGSASATTTRPTRGRRSATPSDIDPPLDDFDDGRYDPDDWDFYTSLRDGNPQTNPKRLVLYAKSDHSLKQNARDLEELLATWIPGVVAGRPGPSLN